MALNDQDMSWPIPLQSTNQERGAMDVEEHLTNLMEDEAKGAETISCLPWKTTSRCGHSWKDISSSGIFQKLGNASMPTPISQRRKPPTIRATRRSVARPVVQKASEMNVVGIPESLKTWGNCQLVGIQNNHFLCTTYVCFMCVDFLVVLIFSIVRSYATIGVFSSPNCFGCIRVRN